MHCISIAGGPTLTAAEVARMVNDRANRNSTYDPEPMRHLAAIERIGCRGISYSNEDFDVLSAALRYARS